MLSLKLKTYLTTFFFLLSLSPTSSQTQVAIDSLWGVYHALKEDTSKILLLGDIAYDYIYKDSDSSLILGNKALEMAKKINFEEGIAKSFYVLGHTHYRLDNFSMANKNYLKSLNIYEKLQDGYTVRCLLNLGLINYIEGNYLGSLNYFNKALKLLDKKKDNILKVAVHNSLGQTFIAQKNYALALNHFNQASSFAKKIDSKRKESGALLGIGKIYFEQDSLSKALFYYTKAQNLLLEINNQISLSYVFSNKGEVYIKQKKFSAALDLFNQSLQIKKSFKDSHGQVITLINMGEVYFKLKKYDLALTVLEEASQLGQQKKFLAETNKAANLLQQVYKAQGQYKNALQYAELYQTTSDSLYSAEKTRAIQELRFEYETTQKEKEIETLAQQNNLQQLRLENNRYYFILLGASIITALLIAALFYFQRQNAKKAAALDKVQTEKLREINKLRTNLFANIAHEFRTPLSLLITPLKEMKTRTFQGNYQHYYGLMLKNAQNLLKLVEQMLDLAKLDEGKLSLQSTKVELIPFAKNAVTQFESLATQKRIKLQLHIPQDKTILSFDKEMMTKIWNNLIENALKFTPESGDVKVKVQLQESYWQLVIQDNGKGINTEELAFIFTRYYRGYQGSKGQTGGLGLALVKQLTELHKGQIEVQSVPNKGSQFLLNFPYLEQPTFSKSKENQILIYGPLKTASSIPKPIKKTPKPTVTLNPPILNKDGIRLLIIEDNKDLNQLLADQLGTQYDIIQAYNGLEGLEKAISLLPDIILTDLMMPTMDGFDFVEKLNQSAVNHIPVIIISALEKEVKEYQLWKEGIVDFLTKPVDLTTLKYKIQNIITKRKQFQQNLVKDLPYLPSENAFKNIPQIDKKLFERFHHLVLENLDNNELQIADVTKQLFVSQRLLSQKIKVLTGLPPSVYIRTLRLKRGKQLIQEGASNIQEVAASVGIRNLSHFSKIFKQEFGISPKQFSKKFV